MPGGNDGTGSEGLVPGANTRAIPQPPESFLVGNLFDVGSADNMLAALGHLAELYGPIYRLRIINSTLVVLSGQEYVDQVCNEDTFEKGLGKALQHIRDLAGDGLFTAFTEEPNWRIAHNILMPVFGAIGVRGMLGDMVDIGQQLVLKLERFGPECNVDVVNDFTRLTLDTIALAAFSYRFNSYYSDTMHPFVTSMVNVLLEAGRRTRRLPMQTALMFREKRQYEADIAYIHQLCDKIVSIRKSHPTDSNDLLNKMLTGRDKETGQGLSDENIRYQMVTFLIAGHETTSGLLSFAFYYLGKHPAIVRKAQAEVDSVTGGRQPITLADLPKFVYIDAILKETLRLNPTAPAFSRKKKGGGRFTFKDGYELQPQEPCQVLLPNLHRDPKVWTDPEVFKPERFLDGGLESLPPNSYKPFGSGERACIGRAFAIQEATLVTAMLLQRFDVELGDPSYELRIKSTLTIKPDGLLMRFRPRDGARPAAAPAMAPSPTTTTLLQAAETAVSATGAQPARSPPSAAATKRLTVLFGSNAGEHFACWRPAARNNVVVAGSCESFAQRLASDAKMRGYAADVQALDSLSIEALLPTDRPVAIITASYEGHPCDNARSFVSALEHAKPGAFAGVAFAVLGCGHRDWVRTYQRVPTLIDKMLAEAGARRLCPLATTDAAGDFFGGFEAWEDGLWKHLQAGYYVQAGDNQAASPDAVDVAASGLQVDVVAEHRLLDGGEYRAGVVVENRRLTADKLQYGGMEKRHLVIKLPDGVTYRAGDYLALMPLNPASQVSRVLRRFNLSPEASVVIRPPGRPHLPTDRPVGVLSLLSTYVELGEYCSRRTLQHLIATTPAAEPAMLAGLQALSLDPAYSDDVVARRVSLLDLLEVHARHPMPFGDFLGFLPPMRMRQYSISSSPLWKPDSVTLTFDVLDAPALSGGHRRKVPVIMVAAGSGIAPFRGFIQERAAMVAVGRQVGPALLYYGCRAREEFVYADDLKRWEALGAVSVRVAFSREQASPAGVPASCKHVDQLIVEQKGELIDLVRAGAHVYVCGSASRLGKSVSAAMVTMYKEYAACDDDQANRWLDSIKGERYATDVFN
ncbi:hypothetical protein PBRA_005128 [Plasmodiophora brassicae]|uniref:Cytochrome P450 n=1 Tax=Plasmodiophora brassicae TaxID=37360 RepID=A0A0G4IMX9_PLABS|nr:hypothetical protein PBRA_005128 [Plasmodiophora brassicae]